MTVHYYHDRHPINVDTTISGRLDAAVASTDPSGTSTTDNVRGSITIGDRRLKFTRAESDSLKAVRECSICSFRQGIQANAATIGES